MTINEAVEVLRKQYNCWTTVSLECPIQCEKCENNVNFVDFMEALKTVLDAFDNCSELPNSSDLVSRSYLLAEYDRQHEGPPGRARKIIEEAPAVLRNSEIPTSLDLISRRAVLEVCRTKYWNGCDDYYPITASGIEQKVKDMPAAYKGGHG